MSDDTILWETWNAATEVPAELTHALSQLQSARKVRPERKSMNGAARLRSRKQIVQRSALAGQSNPPRKRAGNSQASA